MEVKSTRPWVKDHPEVPDQCKICPGACEFRNDIRCFGDSVFFAKASSFKRFNTCIAVIDKGRCPIKDDPNRLSWVIDPLMPNKLLKKSTPQKYLRLPEDAKLIYRLLMTPKS